MLLRADADETVADNPSTAFDGRFSLVSSKPFTCYFTVSDWPDIKKQKA
jgi:hypothetical protein